MAKNKIEHVGYPEYKCRRCGVVFKESLMVLSDFVVGIDESAYTEEFRKEVDRILGHKTERIYIRMVTIHMCSDGGRGVADIIGMLPISVIQKRSKYYKPDTLEEVPYSIR